MFDDIIREHGFVYVDEALSPDGALKVIYGYSEGEKGPFVMEPRVIDVSTGEVLLDLWHLRFNGSVIFESANTLRLRLDDPYQRVTGEAEIDLKARVFTIPQNSRGPEPLGLFRQRAHELRGWNK